jgi:peroxiredoxin
VAQLCQNQDKLRQLGAEVLLVSFASLEKARPWRDKVCPSFRLVVDLERILYRSYGLERSRLRSWNPLVQWRTFRAGLERRGKGGDTTQLGGDFIVDEQGILRLVYRSHDPTDRPAVADLLAILGSLRKKATDS